MILLSQIFHKALSNMGRLISKWVLSNVEIDLHSAILQNIYLNYRVR